MKIAAAVEGAFQGDRIGIDDAASAGQAEPDARYFEGVAPNEGFLYVMAGGLALDIVGERQDDFGNLPLGQSPAEFFQIEVVRPNFLKGGQLSM